MFVAAFSLRFSSGKRESDNFQIYKLFQTVFINVGFLYLGQISDDIPTGHITIINSKCPAPKFIISDLITFFLFILP